MAEYEVEGKIFKRFALTITATRHWDLDTDEDDARKQVLRFLSRNGFANVKVKAEYEDTETLDLGWIGDE